MSNPKSQVKHTDWPHVNLAAITPDATNPGNAAGTATGHISHTIVPPNTAIIPTILITPRETNRPVRNLSIVLSF